MHRALVLPLTLLPITACGLTFDWGGRAVAGSGVQTSETRTVAAFDRIELGGDYQVVVRVGAEQAIALAGDDNLLPLVRTDVRDGTLHIESDEDLAPRREIRIEIGVPSLRGIHSGGSSDVAVRSVRSRTFDAQVSGSSELAASGDFGDLTTSISGSGEIRMDGTADEIDGRVSGSGELHLVEVRARAARIHVSGSGGATVNVAERLDAEISGSGEVRYAGSPEVAADVSGSGSVERI